MIDYIKVWRYQNSKMIIYQCTTRSRHFATLNMIDYIRSLLLVSPPRDPYLTIIGTIDRIFSACGKSAGSSSSSAIRVRMASIPFAARHASMLRIIVVAVTMLNLCPRRKRRMRRSPTTSGNWPAAAVRGVGEGDEGDEGDEGEG